MKVEGRKSKVEARAAELLVTVREQPAIRFVARCNGIVASSTASAQYAIMAVVGKVWPRVPAERLIATRLRRAGDVSTWRVTQMTEAAS